VTGRGVTVALVDSGVNALHPHVGGRVARSLTVVEGERLTVSEDRSGDVSGHGTACAGVILLGAPDVRLLSVRVLDRRLQTTHRLLAEAISWCAGAGVDLVNLSLGTTRAEALDVLEAACRGAVEAGVLLVAAAGPERERSYPAGFGDLVIGVDEDPGVDEWQCRLRAGAAIPLAACGRPRDVEREKVPRNFRGSSFAAARVSAMAARLLAGKPGMGREELLLALGAGTHRASD